MRFVVTGALGHIGSRLIRQLPHQFPGAEIVMLDDMSTQRFPSLFDLPLTARYRFVECDVTKADLEPQWNGFEAQVKTYFESAGKQIEQQHFAESKMADVDRQAGLVQRLNRVSKTLQYYMD